MNNFIKIILIFLVLTSANLYLEAETEVKKDNADCALIIDSKSKSGFSVDPNSYEICDGDLSLKIIYMLYGDILTNDIVKNFVEILIDVPQSNVELNQVSGLSAPIAAIYYALTNLIFSIGSIFIVYQSISYLHKAQVSGQFLGQNKGNAIKVALQGLGVLFLIVPIGNILLIQLIVFLMAILGIMIANYFLSAFLSSVEVKSTKFEVNNESLYHSSGAFSKGLVSIELCKERTNQLILSNKVTATSEWVKESPDSYAWGDNDMEEFNELAHQCLSYYSKGKESSDFEKQVKSIVVHKPTLDDCDDGEVIDEITYHKKDFGSPHTCGKIEYTWPDMETMMPTDISASDSDKKIFFEIVGSVSIGSMWATIFPMAGKGLINSKDYKNNWSAKNNYKLFLDANKKSINDILSSDLKDEEKDKSLKEIFNAHSNLILEKLRKDEVLQSPEYENIENFQLKSNLIYVNHLAISNYLLGGMTTNDQSFSLDTDKVYRPGESVEFFGIDTFSPTIKEASLNLHKSHCAYNWESLYESRYNYLIYEETTEENTALTNFMDKTKKIDFECTILGKNAEDSNKPYIKYVFDGTERDEYFSDIKIGANGVKEKSKDQEAIKITKVKMNELSIKYINEAGNNMTYLTGYNYAVKDALVRSMSERLKETADFKIMIETRQSGWAALGGMMLSISKNMVNASSYSNSILNTANVESKMDQKDGNLEFYNIKAFIIENEENIAINDNTLLTMNLSSLFGSLGVTSVSKNLNDAGNETEDGMLEDILDYILTDIIFSPMKYLIGGSNMDQDESLIKNLESCSKSLDCYPSDSHPLNNMMMFGHAIIDKVVSIILLKYAVDFVVSLLQSMDGDAKGKSGIGDFGSLISKIFGFIPGIGTIASVFISVLTVLAIGLQMILNAIAPFMIILMTVGILCGFMLPTLPYVFFTIVFIGWIITIFIVTIAAPIWILKLANLREDGKTSISVGEIWRITGSVLLKPPLITIAMIIAWTISSVSLYFINSTFFTVLEATLVDSNPISMMIAHIMAYVLYVALIYIILQHSFGLIGKFSDDVSQLIGVNQIGDQQSIQGLQVERLLAAGAVGQQLGGIASKETDRSQIRKSERGTQAFDAIGKKIQEKIASRNNTGNPPEK
jgi:conjugal transfer/type IV secretion protein DotA/TraY